MKRNISLFLLLLIMLPTWGQEIANKNGIRFFKGTFQQALEEAAKQKKPLFVDFYAVWCGPCKRMEKQIFTQDTVGKYFNEKFVCLQLDAEKGENVEIAAKYKVEAFPTLAFLTNDGKAISINVGAMDAEQLLEAAKIAVGEAIGFEQLYQEYRKDPNNLGIQQDLLTQAPRFLTIQEGMDAERWVVRIRKLYRSYIRAKWGPDLINRQDYIIISNLGENDPEGKAEMVAFINSNLSKWREAVGDAAAYYVVMYNDAEAERLAKDGNLKYKDYLEKIKTEYKEAYSVISYTNISPYERSADYFNALYSIYKEKDTEKYIDLMTAFFNKLGNETSSEDYGKAAQNLYYAAGSKLTPDNHRKAIAWVEKALEGESSIMDRINYLVMIGDSYRDLKQYDDAQKYYRQGYAESLQLNQMEMAQQMLQGAIMQKLAALDLLKK